MKYLVMSSFPGRSMYLRVNELRWTFDHNEATSFESFTEADVMSRVNSWSEVISEDNILVKFVIGS